MDATSKTTVARRTPLIVNLIVSVSLTTFLFFLDEGYHNFNWTKSPANWLFFVVYVVFMLLGQTIADKYILRRFNESGKGILTSFIGIPLGLVILFSILFSLKYLSQL